MNNFSLYIQKKKDRSEDRSFEKLVNLKHHKL